MNYMLENECFYSEVQLAFLASLIAAFPELLLLLPLANTRRCFCAAALHVSVCQTLVLHALFTSVTEGIPLGTGSVNVLYISISMTQLC